MNASDHTQQREMAAGRSGAARSIMIVTAVVGGAALVMTGASAAFGAIGAADSRAQGAVMTANVSGISSVSVDIAAADVRIAFGDVDQAELRVDGERRDRWSLERQGDELVVDSDTRFWNFCIAWCSSPDQVAVLTLPRELEQKPVDLDIELGAGQVTTAGVFRALELDMGAGEAELRGVAASLDVVMAAGTTTVDITDAQRVALEISAGTLRGSLTGTAPRETEIEVSAGSLDLTLPDEVYRVEREVALGRLEQGLRTASDAPRVISVEMAAGTVTLQPAR